MRAVFRHELSSYFTGLSGYVFGAFLLLFAGIYTMAYNIKNALSNFEYVLSGMSFIFLIIVPILTMRVLAEEKRQKTDQLLYSLPLTMTQVVMGKYAAMLVMLLVPLAIISIYPLILSVYGNVNLAAAYGALTGFFFLGAALLAVGTFVSSLTESQAVAAGLCFVVLLVNYFLSSLASFLSTTAFASFAAFAVCIALLALIFWRMTKSGFGASVIFIALEAVLFALYTFRKDSFGGLFPTLLQRLSLFARFEQFVNGVFDITAIVFYISVIGVFLFISVQSMEKRRWS
ncbi:MAG: ABC transporter permease subunit [Clostridiales bacterium]|nr:ABC transporter permease subunit [Clostridiales bacterium]